MAFEHARLVEFPTAKPHLCFSDFVPQLLLSALGIAAGMQTLLHMTSTQ